MNEQVTIQFSANTAEAKQLFESLDSGFKKAGDSAERMSKRGIASMVDYASAINMATSAVQALAQAEEQARSQRANSAFGLDKLTKPVLGEGGFTGGDAAAVKNAITGAVLRSGQDPNLVASIAQQLAEENVDIVGGLNPTLDAVLKVNAGHEKGDPKAIVKAMAGLLRTRGLSVNAGNIEAQGQQLYDYLNASGSDLGGAMGVFTSLAQAGGSRTGPALLKKLGLKPEDVDVGRIGMQQVLDNLLGSGAGMSPNERQGVFARLVGDDGAARLQQYAGRGVRLGSGRAAAERDLGIATSGIAADRHRADMQEQLKLAESGEGAEYLQNARRLSRAEWIRRGNPAWLHSIAETAESVGTSLGILSESKQAEAYLDYANRGRTWSIRIQDDLGRRQPAQLSPQRPNSLNAP